LINLVCRAAPIIKSTGNAKAIGKEVSCEIPPIKVGPTKYDAIAIRPTRANPTEGATPGIDAAAKLNAGKKGPIPNPAAPKPMQTMTRLSN
jgi:hypothetical protein